MSSSAIGGGKAALRVLRLRGMSILNQLVLEEVLLRKCQQNYFVLNTDMREEDTSIVLGFSGKIAELVDVAALQAKPVHLVRRYTGGGTVIVDPSTLFASFIMNAKDVPSLPYPRDIMRWSETIYGPVFDALTSAGATSSTPSAFAASMQAGPPLGGACAFAMRENDYVLGAHKIGGNAQTITKHRWVHHTSFLWDFDPERMRYLQLPKKRPEYRRDRPHDSFLMPIRRHVASVAALEEALYTHLHEAFDVSTVSAEDIQSEVRGLMAGCSVETVARTRLESLQDHIDKEAAVGLVKMGTSCTNL